MAWLVAKGPHRIGPLVLQTSDGGESWSEVEEPTGFGGEGYLFAQRDGGPVDLLKYSTVRGDSTVRDLHTGCARGALLGRSPEGMKCSGGGRIREAPLGSLSAVPPTGGLLVQPLAVAAAGMRRWVAAQLARAPGKPVDRFSVLSATLGGAWEVATIRFKGKGQLRAVDFASEEIGVACGTQLVPVVGPLLAHSADGGESWAIASVTSRLDVQSGVMDCSMETEERAWALENSVSTLPPTGRLLGSADGGRTWEEVPLDAAVPLFWRAVHAW